MLVFLNGALVERDSAKVSAFDAGFQHAVGLFETMLARNGRIFRGVAHMARLIDSAAILQLSESLRGEALLAAAEHVLERNGMESARVRLTVTGGDLNWLQAHGRSGRQDPTVLIVAQPPTKYPDAFFDAGVTIGVAESRANVHDLFAGHKTLTYWPRIRELQIAAARGASEALWFTADDQLVSGCVSNVFLVKDGGVITPRARGEDRSQPAAALPGITRAAIVEFAEEAGHRVERRTLTIDDVLAADEMFLTNSSWGVLPVVGVESARIGAGQPGEVTQSLRAKWVEETGSSAPPTGLVG